MDLLVKRDTLDETRLEDAEPAPLVAGEARLRVDAFSLTANNITYAVFGSAMGYWNFFPAPDGWGRVPVWGFGDVVESTVDGVPEGTRVYGYFPMSHELVVTPIRADDKGFVDGAAHRAPMAAAYNHYARVDTDASYDAAHEDVQMLLRPLATTGFLLADFLGEDSRFGAEAVVVSSASSKTAASTAFFLRDHAGLEVIGLTSAGNRAFTEKLGVYDQVVAYGEVDRLDRRPVSFVDIAGSADVRAAVHRHFGDDLRHSAIVGGTHWNETSSDAAGGPLPGPAPAMFFAPDQIKKRVNEWGPEAYDRRLAEGWARMVPWAEGWLEVEHHRGPEAVRDAYLLVLGGGTPPSAGHILSMWS